MRSHPSKQIQLYIKTKAKELGVTQKEYRKNLRCEDCNEDYKVQVHHEFYGKMATIENDALRPLCDQCHTHSHIITGFNDSLPIIDTPEELDRYRNACAFALYDMILEDLIYVKSYEQEYGTQYKALENYCRAIVTGKRTSVTIPV